VRPKKATLASARGAALIPRPLSSSYVPLPAIAVGGLCIVYITYFQGKIYNRTGMAWHCVRKVGASPPTMSDKCRRLVALEDVRSPTAHKPRPSCFQFYTSLCSPHAQEH
jgi:hypothetical protein